MFASPTGPSYKYGEFLKNEDQASSSYFNVWASLKTSAVVEGEV